VLLLLFAASAAVTTSGRGRSSLTSSTRGETSSTTAATLLKSSSSVKGWNHRHVHRSLHQNAKLHTTSAAAAGKGKGAFRRGGALHVELILPISHNL
jgi:hypothetical protein